MNNGSSSLTDNELIIPKHRSGINLQNDEYEDYREGINLKFVSEKIYLAPSAPTTPRMTRDGSTKTLPRNSKILWQQPRSRPESYAEPGEGGKEIESIAASRSSSNLNQGNRA